MQTVNLPKRVVDQVIKVSVAFEALHDELEDYLIARNPALVKKLRRAHREHLAGNARPFIPPH